MATQTSTTDPNASNTGFLSTLDPTAKAATTTAATPAATGYLGLNLNQSVAPEATVEGRINNLTATDATGNYTNDVVRQSVDRAKQSFADRGLLNSSMGVQAGQEAAISKAAEIAAPDAAAVLNQNQTNQAAQNTQAWKVQDQAFTAQNQASTQAASQAAADKAAEASRLAAEKMAETNRLSAEKAAEVTRDSTARAAEIKLRENYLASADKVSTTYQNAVNSINTSNMTPEDKSVAIAQAAAARDGEMAYTNTLYSKQPTWKNEWLAAANATAPSAISGVTDPNALANIAADPAQTPDVRAQAQQQLNTLQAVAAKPAATSAASATPAPSGLFRPRDFSDFNSDGGR